MTDPNIKAAVELLKTDKALRSSILATTTILTEQWAAVAEARGDTWAEHERAYEHLIAHFAEVWNRRTIRPPDVEAIARLVETVVQRSISPDLIGDYEQTLVQEAARAIASLFPTAESAP